MFKCFKKAVSLAAAASVLVCSLPFMVVSAATNGNNVRVSHVEFFGESANLGARVFVRNSGDQVECRLVLAVYKSDKSLKSAAVCKGANAILEAGTLDASDEGDSVKAFVWKAGDNAPIAEAADLSKDFNDILNNIEITFDGVSFADYIGENFDSSKTVYSKAISGGGSFPEIRVKSDNNAVKAKILTDESKNTSEITIEYGLEDNIKETYNWDSSHANAYHMIYSKKNTKTYTVNYLLNSDGKVYGNDLTRTSLPLNGNYPLKKWYEKSVTVSGSDAADISFTVTNWPKQDVFIAVKPDDSTASITDIFTKADGSAVTASDIITQGRETFVKDAGTVASDKLWLIADIRDNNMSTGAFGTPTFQSGSLSEFRQHIRMLNEKAEELRGAYLLVGPDSSLDEANVSFKLKKSAKVYLLSVSDSATLKDATGWEDKSADKTGSLYAAYTEVKNPVTAAYLVKNGLVEESKLIPAWNSFSKLAGYVINDCRVFGYDNNSSVKGVSDAADKSITVDGETKTLSKLISNDNFDNQPTDEELKKWYDAVYEVLGEGEKYNVGSSMIITDFKDLANGGNGILRQQRFEYSPLKTNASTMTDGTAKYLYPAWSDRDNGAYNSICFYPQELNIYGSETIAGSIDKRSNFGTKDTAAYSFKVNRDAEVLVFTNKDSYVSLLPDNVKDGWAHLYYYKNGILTNKNIIGSPAAAGHYYGPDIYNYYICAAKEYNAGDTVEIYGGGAESGGIMVVVNPITR